jgi:hypothetical protein
LSTNIDKYFLREVISVGKMLLWYIMHSHCKSTCNCACTQRQRVGEKERGRIWINLVNTSADRQLFSCLPVCLSIYWSSFTKKKKKIQLPLKNLWWTFSSPGNTKLTNHFPSILLWNFCKIQKSRKDFILNFCCTLSSHTPLCSSIFCRCLVSRLYTVPSAPSTCVSLTWVQYLFVVLFCSFEIKM